MSPKAPHLTMSGRDETGVAFAMRSRSSLNVV
jgi:hypothetical protein